MKGAYNCYFIYTHIYLNISIYTYYHPLYLYIIYKERRYIMVFIRGSNQLYTNKYKKGKAIDRYGIVLN